MRVWNPQLEQHLETLFGDDESLAAAPSEPEECSVDEKESSIPTESSFAEEDKRGKVNRLLSQPMMEWIGIGILAVCCVGTSGLVSSRNAGVLMAFLLHVRWLIWRQKQCARKRNEENFQECRNEVSSLLGSIGAPPLQVIWMPIENANLDTELLLDFARAHIDFFKQVDHSLDKLRTGVSMSLQSTPRSVERVELATLNRNTRSTVVLPVARKMLLQIMVNHYKLLTKLQIDDDGDDVDAPAVITLTWLKALRSALAGLLSTELSRLLLPSGVLHDLSLPGTTLEHQIHTLVVAAKESTKYLASMFSISQAHEASALDSLDLNLICQQFDKASVALWACQAACAKESPYDRTEPDHTSVLEFLEHFDTLVHSVGGAKERLIQSTRGKVSEQCQEKDKVAASQIEQPTDAKDYEYPDMSSRAFPEKESVKRKAENKTVIFSGSGSVQRPVLDDWYEAESECDVTLPTTQHYIAAQDMMLHELQKRLAQMDPSIAVNENDNGEDGSEMELSVRQQVAPTTSMFLGSSGNLLSELKNAIGSEDVLSQSPAP